MMEDCRLGKQVIIQHAAQMEPGADEREIVSQLHSRIHEMLRLLDFRLYVRKDEVHAEWSWVAPRCPAMRTSFEMELMEAHNREGLPSVWSLDIKEKCADFLDSNHDKWT